MPEWRPNLYVVARFLDALHQGPRSRSDLQAAAGVNYDVFRRYVAFLETRTFIVVRSDGAIALTPAGLRVRSDLRAWIESFLGATEDGPPATRSRAANGADPEP